MSDLCCMGSFQHQEEFDILRRKCDGIIRDINLTKTGLLSGIVIAGEGVMSRYCIFGPTKPNTGVRVKVFF